MSALPPLPTGFQLEAAAPAAPPAPGRAPPLPQGFQLDSQPAVATPPQGLVPGSREYADWAAQQARAGAKLPQVSPPPPPAAVPDPAAPSAVQDSYVSQGLSGFNEGIAKGAGFPVDATATLLNAATGGANALFHTNIPQITDPVGGSKTFEALMAPTIKPESTDPSKKFVRRIAQELGMQALPGVGLAARTATPVRSIVEQALATTGAGTGAATAQQVAPDNPWAELAGEILGGASVAGLSGVARRAITPIGVPAVRRAAVDTMRNAGVDLTAGQATGSKALRYAESELGGQTAEQAMQRQSEQFTQAALDHAGIRATRATPDVMDSALTDIGHEFDNLATRNPLVLDQQLSSDLGSAVHDYNAVVPPSSRAPIIENTLRDLVNTARTSGPTLSGDAYKALRSRIDAAARRTSDADLAATLRDIRSALDGGVERSIAANNPADLGAWRDVRNRYRNMLVIERAAAANGEASASGLISPARLATATKAVHGRRNYIRGNSDFADLAHAGQETMTPLPQSGTAPRLAARSLWGASPTIAGALAGNMAFPGVGAIVGGAAGHLLPHVVGRALLSRPGRAYLSNRAIQQALIRPGSYLAPAYAATTNLEDNTQRRIRRGG